MVTTQKRSGLGSWFGGARGSEVRAAPGRRKKTASARPRLEKLEGRRLLATWTGDLAASDPTSDGFLSGLPFINTNWQGDTLPLPGETLIFPNGAATKTPRNNFPLGTSFQLQLTGSGYTITGNRILLPSGAALVDSSTGAANSIQTDLDVAANTTINVAGAGHTLTLTGLLTGTAGAALTKAGRGVLDFGGTANLDGDLVISAGELAWNGVATGTESFVLDGGTLKGTGTITGPVESGPSGGTIAPGASPGTLSTGSIVLNPQTVLEVEIDGPNPGEFDVLLVTGTVNLASATLDVVPGVTPAVGETYVIVDNDGADAVTGQFAGLPEGASFTAGPATYTITYAGGDGNDIALEVTAINGPPVGAPDVYATPRDTTLQVFALEGVLINDTDPEGLALAAVLVSGPANGSLQLFGDGSLIYTPARGFTGIDTFIYKPADAVTPLASIAPVTVTIYVNESVAPPIAQADTFILDEAAPFAAAAPGVLVNDASPSGLALTAVLVTGPANAEPGSFVLNADGSFAYTGQAGFAGADSFVYRAVDAGGNASDPTTVTLLVDPVNVAPTAVDDAFAVSQGQILFISSPGVLANDTDPDGDALSAFQVAGPGNGSLTLNSDGSFVYTPNADFSGTDSFTYRVSDGSLPSATTATVTITVSPVNRAPVALDNLYATTEGQALSVAAPGVLDNDTDPDGDPLSAVLVSNPIHGTLALNADGSFTYTPNPLFFGTDTFTYRASDGALPSNLATVTINVSPINNAPVAADDAFSTTQGASLNVSAPGVLGNDSDPDGDLLSAFLLSNPTGGTLTLDSSGAFVYTPRPRFSGTDTFTYRAWDGTAASNVATVTITVAAADNTPVAVADAYATNEDEALVVAAPGVLANDIDPVGGPLTAVLATGPMNGSVQLAADGSFTYTPVPNFSGTDTFSYIAVNSTGASPPALVTITVRPVDEPPVAQDDAFTIERDQRLVVPVPGLLGNDRVNDPSDTLRAVLVNPPLSGQLSLAADGSFNYLPFAGFVGADSFTYYATDGTLNSNLATVTIQVIVPPNPPTTPTARLLPSSDTGLSDTDRITRDNTPTFVGTTGINQLVRLYATPVTTAPLSAAATPVEVGSTTADSQGNWEITASALPDGVYEFTVSAFRADGVSTGTIGAGPLLVDTVAPVVTSATLQPRLGQIYAGFQDDRSGMADATLAAIGNYSFARLHSANARGLAISRAEVLPVAVSTAVQTVVLTPSLGRKLQTGRYLLAVLSGGVTDVAGNALDGDFNGSYPSGDGVAGSDFLGQFNVRNRTSPVNAAVPTYFVPIVSDATPTATPAGPRALLAARRRK